MFNSSHRLQSQGLCLDPPQHGVPRAVLWDLGFEVVQRHWEPQGREQSRWLRQAQLPKTHFLFSGSIPQNLMAAKG